MAKKSKAPARAKRPPRPAKTAHRAAASLQRQLREANAELSRSKLALARSAEELASSRRARDRFLSLLSHELRTPLTAMLLWSRLLTTDGPLDPALQEGLNAIATAAREQQALVDALLDYSRLATGRLRLQVADVALATLAQETVAAMRARAAEKNLNLETSFDAAIGIVQADGRRLQQVFTNLLDNAVKFTPAMGRVAFTLTRDGDLINAAVIDTGCGIAEDLLPGIFVGSMDVDSSTIPSGGLGLGLSIARHLVVLHGGEISAESEGLAKGSRFLIRLPLPRRDPA